MKIASTTQFNTGTKTKERQDERLFGKSILSSDNRDNNGGLENSSYTQSMIKPDDGKLGFTKSILSSDRRDNNGGFENSSYAQSMIKPDDVKLGFTKSILSSDNRYEDRGTEECDGRVNLVPQSSTKTLSQLNKNLSNSGIVKTIRTKHKTKCEDSTVKASVCCGL